VTYFDDLWSFDGTTWTQVETADASVGPAARASAALASLDGSLVLFGGVGATDTLLSDTWTWNGTTWTAVTNQGPTALGTSPGAWSFAPSGNSLLLFGVAGFLGDSGPRTLAGVTWSWNGSSWTQLASSGPPGDGGFAAFQEGVGFYSPVTLAAVGSDILYFALDAGLMWTWVPTSSSWTELPEPSAPTPPRHSASVAAAGSTLVLFGGIADDSEGVPLGDTWIWDGSTWTQGPDGPPARAGGSMAPYGSSGAVLFGGATSTAMLADTWIWDGSTWTSVPGPGPTARSGASMTSVL
jgi:hypothetical protein